MRSSRFFLIDISESMVELRKNIVKITAELKGDWKPIVFLLTDGVPTDETKTVMSEWKQNWQRSANLVAVSFSNDTDTQPLSELTDTVLNFKSTRVDSYKQFFKWVTDSIKASSVSVDSNTTGFELAKLDDNIISKINLSKSKTATQIVDNNFVVLSAKCQNPNGPYLIKYKKKIATTDFGGVVLDTLSYRLVGAFQVDNSYFELSDNSNTAFKVNTEELVGAPSCPCCGNQFAFAVCSCRKLHCIGDEKESTCPWYGNIGFYGSVEGGFDVNRTQG